MPRSKAVTLQRDPLPDNFDSLEEFWAFWNTHSTADYEDQMEDVALNKELEVPEFESYKAEVAFWDELDTAPFMEDDGKWFRFEVSSKSERQNRLS